MSVDQHYENFPVASALIPAAIRPYVVAIYRFARHADDVADEGDAAPGERIAALDTLSVALAQLWRGEPTSVSVVNGLRPLRDAAIAGIDETPFQRLLSAFRQDVSQHRYQSTAQLLDYCARSANPVGRLMLALVGVTDRSSIAQSDSICSALQLINFWQDAAIDASRGRIYVPSEAFARFGVSETAFPQHPMHRELMRAQCEETRDLLLSGTPLLARLSGRFRLEIAFTIAGGERILEKVAANDFDVTQRPTLRWYDSARLLWLAFAHLWRTRGAKK
jgi:squalene synthase HpnC